MRCLAEGEDMWTHDPKKMEEQDFVLFLDRIPRRFNHTSHVVSRVPPPKLQIAISHWQNLLQGLPDFGLMLIVIFHKLIGSMGMGAAVRDTVRWGHYFRNRKRTSKSTTNSLDTYVFTTRRIE